MLLERFDEARLLLDAKGWTLEGVAGEIKEQVEKQRAEGKQPALAEFEYSQATLSQLSGTSRPVPPPLAELIEQLKTLPGRERATEIVETGLRVLRGQPAPQSQAPQEVAEALLAQFPTDALAQKLAEALVKRVQGKVSPLTALARRLARTLAKRLGDFGEAGEELELLHATLDATDQRVEQLEVKLDISEEQRRKDKRELLAAVFAVGALTCVFTQCQSTTTAPANAATAAPAPAAQAPAKPAQKLGALAQAEGPEKMGEKKAPAPPEQPEFWVPKDPLPEQKLAPCNPAAGETDLNGHCWVKVADMKPPCQQLYRYGNACYRPVAASPRKSVGDSRVPQKPNPRG